MAESRVTFAPQTMARKEQRALKKMEARALKKMRTRQNSRTEDLDDPTLVPSPQDQDKNQGTEEVDELIAQIHPSPQGS